MVSDALNEENTISPSSSRGPGPASNPYARQKAPGRRRKAAKIAWPGPDSSPLAPTPSGFTPEQPRVRRSSIQLPAQVESYNAPISSSPLRAEELEEVDVEMDTPTKKRPRHTKSNRSEEARQPALSPLRQMTVLENSTFSVETSKLPRPALPIAHTSPELHDETERRNERPTVTERSASNPVTPQKKLSGTQVDRELTKFVREGPKKPQHLKKGFLYFYNVISQDDVQLIKIGETGNMKDRSNSIMSTCKHRLFEEHPKAIAQEIPFKGFAEKLIHKELENFRYNRRCICGTQHREYYIVSERVALEAFHRWREFCDKQPWTADGKLLPRWEERLKNQPWFEDAKMDFDRRNFAKRWHLFTAPTKVDNILYDAAIMWKEVFPHRWSIVAIAELLTIIFLSPSSSLDKTWMAVVSVLFLMDKMQMVNKHVTKPISQLSSGGLWKLMDSDTTIDYEKKPDYNGPTPQTISNQSAQQETPTRDPVSTNSREIARDDRDCPKMGDVSSDGNDMTSPGDRSDVHYTDSGNGSASSTCSSPSLKEDGTQTSAPSRQEDGNSSEQRNPEMRAGVEVIELSD
ncbi:uncharacterized protein CTRU02_202403 [Colletotrichum truncatum]|uniref:Uncharacterized protein n=1 Tax=Colletotrichum truncatum TaxID=5467 RepID=A0ACC3ZKA3_COLTU|nr:uncharacterized protein CTRU02_01564 [Colletotrichum truncatum]KAF6799884.1 hypothetical protein CTRU02_01564 [Colletotrichum truncatum]